MSPVPLALIRWMSRLPPESRELYEILEQSGDHLGPLSSTALLVTWNRLPPVRSILKISKSPSGNTSLAGLFVRLSGTEPSGFMVKISLSPVRLDSKAIRPFGPGTMAPDGDAPTRAWIRSWFGLAIDRQPVGKGGGEASHRARQDRRQMVRGDLRGWVRGYASSQVPLKIDRTVSVGAVPVRLPPRRAPLTTKTGRESGSGAGRIWSDAP